MGLIFGALIALASAIASAPDGGSTDSGGTWAYGDVNCDGIVTPGDGLDILLVLAGLAAEETVAACDGGGSDGWVPGDVTCDNAVTAVDALAITAFSANLILETGVICAYPGDEVGAPPASLTCETVELQVLEPVKCRYDVGPSPIDPDVHVDTSDGVAQITVMGSSAACDPEGVCSYAKSAELDVSFPAPGVKTITLTACAGNACAVRTVEIKVSEP